MKKTLDDTGGMKMKNLKRFPLVFLLMICLFMAVKCETVIAYTNETVEFNTATEVSLSGYSIGYYYFSTPYDGMTVKISLSMTDDSAYTMKTYYGGTYTSFTITGSQEITTTLGKADSYYVYITPSSTYKSKSKVSGTLTITDVSTYASSISTVGDTERVLMKGCSADLDINSDGGITRVTWSSSDTQVAAVDAEGVVTGQNTGTATITAKLEDGNSVEYVIKVSDSFKIGEKYYISTNSYSSVTYEISSAYDNMTYALEISPVTSNKYCVYLDGKEIQDGDYTTDTLVKEITFATEGKHKIRIYGYSGNFSGSISIKDTSTYAKSIKKKSNPSKMTVNATQQLKVTMNGVGKVTWKTSNKKVATVDEEGLVTAKMLGKATITATLKGGNSVKYTIVVNEMKINIWTEETFSLQSYVKQISNYKKGTWKSADKKIVTVSGKGKITAKEDGYTYSKSKVTFKASGTTYTFAIYKYDKESMYDEAIKKLKNKLKNPSSLIVNSYWFNSVKTAKGGELYVYIDYSAMNGFGGYNRKTCIYTCSDGYNSIRVE